ncbi:ribonuclease HIII [Dubosiella newyorkensis]|uniref:ribonuclease HIII n=1 Tax=Dubosiella newyorkensis TaxID=1862672 RepID=UPI0032B2EC5F
MPTITKTMSLEDIDSLKQRIAPYVVAWKQSNYTIFQAKLESMSITAYASGKVVYQGKDLSFLEPEPEKKTEAIFPQAGSDEVGTGDYFGPVVVAACIVDQKAAEKLMTLQITDSKKMKDAFILQVEETIKELCPHSILIVNNAKYNAMSSRYNMVAMKCILHNQAYWNLEQKGNPLPSLSVVDQFVQEKSYYRYLQGQDHVVKDLHFETKAESKYLAVAAASVLARATFLKYMDKMSEKYDFLFPKGAGAKVDQSGVQFVERYGWDPLYDVAKLHFKNTEKIKHML